MMAVTAPRHGNPEVSRNDRLGFDKYLWPAGPRWPQGLELHVYDNGRVKIGRKHSVVEVVDVMNRKRGGSSWGSAHVIARFRPAPDQDYDQEEDRDVR
jgi:hypothetical protein